MPIYGKRRRRDRIRDLLRRHARYWVPAALVLLLAAGAGTAMAAIVLRGEGTVTAPAYRQEELKISREYLSGPLVPGSSVDLIFTVRNPNPFPVVVDRVALASALRQAKPAGCAAKVAGPITRRGGYPLPSAQKSTVPSERRLEVVVRDAFTLAASATSSCGFTARITVGATQGIFTSAPPPPAPPSDDSVSPRPPESAEPSTAPPSATTQVPPSVPADDRDPADVG